MQIWFRIETDRMMIKNVKPFVLLLLLVQPAGTAGAQVVHAQQRAVAASAAPAEVVAIATGQGVRAVTPATTPAVVSTTLSPGQSQTRPLAAPSTKLNISFSIFITSHYSSQISLVCRLLSWCRYAVAARKVFQSGPPADAQATTASTTPAATATATAGHFPADQGCRETPGDFFIWN